MFIVEFPPLVEVCMELGLSAFSKLIATLPVRAILAIRDECFDRLTFPIFFELLDSQREGIETFPRDEPAGGLVSVHDLNDSLLMEVIPPMPAVGELRKADAMVGSSERADIFDPLK